MSRHGELGHGADGMSTSNFAATRGRRHTTVVLQLERWLAVAHAADGRWPAKPRRDRARMHGHQELADNGHGSGPVVEAALFEELADQDAVGSGDVVAEQGQDSP